MRDLSRWLVALAVLPLVARAAGADLPAPRVDHHQHLFRMGLPGATESPHPFDAERLVRYLDDAGIQRAVLLSLAYQMGNPHRPVVGNEYEQVRTENDWTSTQVSLHPDRLVGFCSFNPLKPYALQKLRRCAANPRLRTGIKLHFGNSDVQFEKRDHIARLREVFAAADHAHMAIVLHMRSSVNMRRPFGATQARIFLNEVLSEFSQVRGDHQGARHAFRIDPLARGRREPRLRSPLKTFDGRKSRALIN
jgi:predicted TIM-barrel fold metal-dependent hydrolase